MMSLKVVNTIVCTKEASPSLQVSSCCYYTSYNATINAFYKFYYLQITVFFWLSSTNAYPTQLRLIVSQYLPLYNSELKSLYVSFPISCTFPPFSGKFYCLSWLTVSAEAFGYLAFTMNTKTYLIAIIANDKKFCASS